MPARVFVIAGPSGAGKSRLAGRIGLPLLRLDDFYKNAGDPTLPHLRLTGGAPIVDWDDPRSWRVDEALATIQRLCETGTADVPVYDIAQSRCTGHRALDLGGEQLFLAEGIFAHEVVPGCRERGLLAGAVCVTQQPVVTFLRRLTRDLREHRKPPLVLLRRGLHLMREQPSIVAGAVAAGCEAMSPEHAFERVERLLSPA